MALGDVFFVMGNLPRALATYDRVIARRASHHALLRKGIILSVMDRPDEALPVLARVIESHWLPGEAHYWTARNQLRLGALSKAAASADVAKRSLAGDPATRLVAGQVAVAQGRWDAAETDLTAAVSISRAKKELAGSEPLCEGLFLLGRLDAQRENWPSGLARFEGSRACYRVARADLDRREERIRGWALAPQDERLLLLSNDQEKGRAEEGLAAAAYHAALCALRAGQPEAAAALAQEAAKSDAYRTKAEAVLAELTRE